MVYKLSGRLESILEFCRDSRIRKLKNAFIAEEITKKKIHENQKTVSFSKMLRQKIDLEHFQKFLGFGY